MTPPDRPADEAATRRLYDPATTAAVYARLAALAGGLLAAGRSVVIDAACNARGQRDCFAAVAREVHVPLFWLDLEPVPAEAAARVDRRRAAGGDASDATADVVRGQLAAREPITAAEVAAVPAARWIRVAAADMADPQRLDAVLAAAVPEEAPLAGSLSTWSGDDGGRGG